MKVNDLIEQLNTASLDADVTFFCSGKEVELFCFVRSEDNKEIQICLTKN